MANKKIDERDLEQISGGADGVVAGPEGPGAGPGPEKRAIAPTPPIIAGPINLSKDTKQDEENFNKDGGKS